MISAKQAAEIVSRKFQNATPKRVADLDETRYVVEAPSIKSGIDIAVPFYYVTKDGKDCDRFNPMDDLNRFIEAGKTAVEV